MNFDFDFDNFDFDFENDANLNPKLKRLDELLLPQNFPYNFKDFCGEFLIIKSKEGGYIPFIFNESQKEWFRFLLQNYKKYGCTSIKFLVVKFRQNGISTVSEAFAFYAGLVNKYNVGFVGANAKNTENLYRMLDGHCNNLKGMITETKRHAGRLLGLNNSLFYFSVASGSTMRGLTIGCLVSDEMGERSDDMDLEALSQVKNYVYLPLGTPKGINNLLYLAYIEMSKTEDVLFLAWWQMKENFIEVDSKYKPCVEVENYLKKYNLDNLPLGKKAWIEQKYLRIKTRSFVAEDVLNQEYPPNIKIGFESSAANCFCNSYYINLAFQAKYGYNTAEAIVGIDIAGHGEDKSIMCVRFNTTAFFFELKSSTMTHSGFDEKARMAVNILRNNFASTKIKQINVDATGVGEGFPDFLTRYRPETRIVPVHFSSKVEIQVDFETIKQGVRDFIYFKLKKWLETCNVFLPEANQLLKEELLATEVKSVNGIESIVPKEEIKKSLRRSPDYADSLALTFIKNELPNLKIFPHSIITQGWY